jgi:hypothetical protein
VNDVLLHLIPWSVSGSSREERLYVLALALLLFGTGLSLVALLVRRLDATAIALASAGAAAWLLSNAPGEGSSLVEIFHGNGLTVADLAAVPAGMLVAVLCARRLLEQ